MQEDHPDRGHLALFALGQLDKDNWQALADHLARCTVCEEALATIPDDGVVSAVRAVVTSGKDTSATPDPAATPRPNSNARADSFLLPLIPGYEVLRLLGAGGMGKVYLARDPRLKREVALKVLRRGDGLSQQERFQLEAEAAARLRHPHIVQIHSLGQWQPPGETEPAPYFALEYVPGGTLAAVLAQGPLPVEEAAHLVEVLARAVQAAHAAGIVHRDLKPGNVLLDAPLPGNSGSLRCGFPKIADFGLARLLDAADRPSSSGMILGTPRYMAPEQAMGLSDIGPGVDVWALGVILYEALTGVAPFQGESVITLLNQVCQAVPVSPRSLRGAVPPPLEKICLRCLEKDPSRRYPSAADLAADLSRFRAARPASEVPSTVSLLREDRHPAPETSRKDLATESTANAEKKSQNPGSSAASQARMGLGWKVGMGVFVGLCVLAALCGQWFWPAPSSGPTNPPLPLAGNLDIEISEAANDEVDKFNPAPSRQNLKLWERQALPLRPRDWIRIEAKVNRPAYLYLVWVGADGVTTPLWPWVSPDPKRPLATFSDPRGQERRRERLLLPADFPTGGDAMPLGPGPAGLECLLLLARDEPLSEEDTAELARILAPHQRQPGKDMHSALWLENGERVKENGPRAPIVSKGADTGDGEQQVRAVMRAIHEKLGYVRGVCFGNQGK